MRWVDRHGQPLPLDDVFSGHLKVVKRRLQMAETRRRARRDDGTEWDVTVRGSHGGLSQGDAREPAYSEMRFLSGS